MACAGFTFQTVSSIHLHPPTLFIRSLVRLYQACDQPFVLVAVVYPSSKLTLSCVVFFVAAAFDRPVTCSSSLTLTLPIRSLLEKHRLLPHFTSTTDCFTHHFFHPQPSPLTTKMLRTLILLAATLAVVALAAPTPTSQHAAKRWSLDSSFAAGASNKHSFKSSTRGHRGHRDPRTELSRVYSKFHWSIELPSSNTVWDFDFPSAGGSDQSYGLPDTGSSSRSSDGSYGTSDDSSSSDGSSYGSTDGSVGSSPSVVPEPAQTSAAVHDTYATKSYASVEPSSAAVNATSVASATSAYATAIASAAASASSDDDGTGEVTASPEENESEYLSPVTIGGQKLNLNFDTGSADL